MLNPLDREKIKSAVEGVVDLLGVPVTWTQTEDPYDTKDVVAGFKSVSWRDEELVNAFGVGAKVFTIKVEDIAVVKKFDKLVVLGERYTINSVMPVHLNGELVFWKAIVRGKE